MKKIIMFAMALGALDTAMSQDTGRQLIVNGNFMENNCTQDWCTSTSQTLVKGWIPKPQIELAWANKMNFKLPRGQRVVELATSKNTCIEQRLSNLQPGIYQLKYKYAAREGRVFSDCQFEISFGGKVLKRITPTNSDLNQDTIEFEVRQVTESGLTFCGVGGAFDNGQGAILKQVSLIRKSDLPVLPIETEKKSFEFSQSFVNKKQFAIDSLSEKCILNQYPFEEGKLEITFDFNLIADTEIKNSFLFVMLNGQQIEKLLPSDNKKTIKFAGDIKKGLYALEFCPIVDPDEAPHQFQITNVAASLKQCSKGLSDNLIVNGGFDQNSCSQNFCTWNQQNVGNNIVGWIPSPEIEIGKGNKYNYNLGNSWVAQLDANSNTCIRQNVALQSGTHTLSFDWAARMGINLNTSMTFEVKINGGKVFEGIPKDFSVRQEKIPLQLQNLPAQSSIEFCGTGKSDSLGALIGNVKLQKNLNCNVLKY